MQAQTDTCGTDAYHEMMMEDPEYAHWYNETEARIYQELNSGVRAETHGNSNCENEIVVPVAIHFNGGVDNSNMACIIATSEAQIEQLNEDFTSTNPEIVNYENWAAACPDVYPIEALSEGLCIKFCLAKYDHPEGSGIAEGDYAFTFGKYEFGNNPAEWSGYMNIFVHDNPEKPNEIGKAHRSGAARLNGDGLRIGPSFFGGPDVDDCTSGKKLSDYGDWRVGTHETGHFFGLRHIFDGCNNGDMIDDTPDQDSANSVGYVDINTCTSMYAHNSCNTQDFFFNHMDYAKLDRTMFTADQADVMFITGDHDLWKTTAVDCKEGPCFATGPSQDIHINNNTTYNVPQTMPRNLIIHSGVQVIVNSELKFGPQRGIIVEQGAELILYGKLTNACGPPWKGVEVRGDNSTSQYFGSNHGKFVSHPGAIVENADIGVQLYSSEDNDHAGGILSSRATTFRNNRIAVDFAPYVNYIIPDQERPYSGHLSKCSFITDDDYLHYEDFSSFIHMVGVNGVAILGCTFANNQGTPKGSFEQYGYGIHAINSGFRVNSVCNQPGPTPQDPCNDYTHTLFKNLGYAISAKSDLDKQKPFSVQRARFYDCYYGILNDGISQSVLLFNKFYLGNLPDPSLPLEINHQEIEHGQVGIYFFRMLTGITFQENTFDKVSGGALNTVGTYCHSLGFSDANVIRRNTYTGIDYANFALERNERTIAGQSNGLHYLCNTNSGISIADFSVKVRNTITETHGIRKHQGERETQGIRIIKSAGNTFSRINVDIFNDNKFDKEIWYFYDGNDPSEIPLVAYNDVVLIDTAANECAVDYCDLYCIADEVDLVALKQGFFDEKSNYTIAKDGYDQAIAVSDSQIALEKAIDMSFTQEAMDKASHLILQKMLYDTSAYNKDSLNAWYIHIDNPASYVQLASNYFADGRRNEAILTIYEAISRFDLDSAETADFGSIAEIMDLIDTQSVYSLDSLTLAVVGDYTTGHGIESSGMARNILSLYGHHFPPPFDLPDIENQPNRLAENPNESKPDKGDHFIVVYPNPASDQVHFSVINKEADLSGYRIEVCNLFGQVMWSKSAAKDQQSIIWQTANIPNGVYFYRLMQDENDTIQFGQFFINK